MSFDIAQVCDIAQNDPKLCDIALSCVKRDLQNGKWNFGWGCHFLGLKNLWASGDIINRFTGLNKISLERTFKDQLFHVVLM